MNLLDNIYSKAAVETEKNFKFWENYLKELHSLDFSVYSNKLTVPTLVPIGNHILFRGELKHTNELLVSLGADYFVKCSLAQAEILRQHRIKDAQAKLDMFKKESQYLESQISFRNNITVDPEFQEIIEYCTEEEEKYMREQHRESVRKQKQQQKLERDKLKDTHDEELWNRLDELELQEELENELNEMNNDRLKDNSNTNDTFVIKDEEIVTKPEKEIDDKPNSFTPTNSLDRKELKTVSRPNTHVENSKHDLLQQVIEKQYELENKLTELKHREREKSKTESDILSKLDDMEELDELEDEINRLDDVLDNEDIQETDESKVKISQSTVKRQVSFADEDDMETLEITFKHSDVEPNKNAFDPKKGLQKPSDIYELQQSLNSGVKSILKKKYYHIDNDNNTKEIKTKSNQYIEEVIGNIPRKVIVVNDVIEKEDEKEIKQGPECRPTSLFKQKRMQCRK